MHINMTLGEKVRQLREDMDLTQGQLGKELGTFGYSVKKPVKKHKPKYKK